MDFYEKKSNLVLGLVGAIVGSLVGVALWVIIYKIGFIAGIAGFVIAAGALRGYELLGGALDKKGVIISIIIFIAMVFVAQYIAVAVDYYTYFVEEFGEEYSISFTGTLKELPDLLELDEAWGYFVKDLIIGYALSVWSAFSHIRSKF